MIRQGEIEREISVPQKLCGTIAYYFRRMRRRREKVDSRTFLFLGILRLSHSSVFPSSPFLLGSPPVLSGTNASVDEEATSPPEECGDEGEEGPVSPVSIIGLLPDFLTLRRLFQDFFPPFCIHKRLG